MNAGVVYSFGAFRVDGAARRLTRDGKPVAVPDRHLGVLLALLARAGTVVPKNVLVDAVWNDVAVTDNSLEQAISMLRRVLGAGPDGRAYIETVPRQGYRFVGSVAKSAARVTDDAIGDLLAPHRAWIEGRAALESFERDQILRARRVFERVLERIPDHAAAHVGLANACVMQFEMTRADEHPDRGSLEIAARHSRDACRLEPEYGEAWATLGFVLDRTGNHLDALAASRRAVALEPDNWRHHFRLAYVGWGEERLRAARRTLALLPGFALAHWLLATVYVARQALDEAERELAAAGAAQSEEGPGTSRFSAVAVHWLRGLVHLARGDERAALEAFRRELSHEGSGHLYGRECCANAWYAIGAVRRRAGDSTGASAAFQQALDRVPVHALARLALVSARPVDRAEDDLPAQPMPVDAALAEAVRLSLAGHHDHAAVLMERSLASAPPGPAGWILPIEPLLHVSARSDVWAPALARLRTRAA